MKIRYHIKCLLIGFMLLGLICGIASAQESTGDRIWDADENQSLEYTWTAQSYSGFYYDLDSGEGSENLTIKLDSDSDRTIDKGELVYSTKPINTNFEFDEWGSYQIVGFMAERFFAGYTENTIFADKNVSLISDGQLAKVLLDDDEENSFFSGSSIILEEGYKAEIVEVDLEGDQIFISLMKDGKEVDSGVISSNEDYVYEIDLGAFEDIPIIAVHFTEIFRGAETNAVFVEGIFQISDEPIEIDTGDNFGKMEVETVSATEITMENDDSISLSEGKTITIMGSLKFIVADNDTLRFGPFVDISEPGTHELRGTVAEEEVLEWTPLSFEGFYYDIDEGVGTESLEILSLDGRRIDEGNLVYSSSPNDVSFEHEEWGKFEVIGFLAEKYLVGYPENEFTDGINILSKGQISTVLIDNDEKSTITPGSFLTLEEGYALEIVGIDVDGEKVFVSLTKDGREVDSGVVSSNDDYVYETDFGSTEAVPTIVVHFTNVFRGTEANAAFVEGIFQVSDEYIEVDIGDEFGKMEITKVTDNLIEMENDDFISLSKDKTVSIMDSVSFKVADSDVVRYYPFVEITTVPSRSLAIDMPSIIRQGDSMKISVTFRGAAVDDAIVKFDGERVGLTARDGIVFYVPQQVGTFTFKAEKEGFVSASKEVEVVSPQDMGRKIFIKVSPDVVFEGDTIIISTIKVTNADPVEGVEIFYDGKFIGNTSADGTLSYIAKDPGIHKITSVADEFLDAEFDFEVLALVPEFEFSNLKITPSEVDTRDIVTITVDVKNTGTAKGETTVDLLVNGNTVDSKTISLDIGEEKTVEFIRTESEPGTYTVQIASETGIYTVTKAIPSTGYFVSLLILVFAAFAIRSRSGK